MQNRTLTVVIALVVMAGSSAAGFPTDISGTRPSVDGEVTEILVSAYRFLLDGSLPELSYLTRMDYFLIGSTLLVLITIIQVVITTHAADRDHSRKAQRINVHSRWLFPAMFVGLTAAALLVG